MNLLYFRVKDKKSIIMKNNFLFKKHVLLLFPFLLILSQSQEVKAQFANGADVGWLSQMEAQGYVFKDNYGVQKNCLDILKEKGINALRFRVWVNPSNKYCSKQDVAYMAHRADSMGFSVMLDFHLSDTWADPGHQTKPAAWAAHTVSQLDTDIYKHVYDMLDTLKSLGVTPKWVQIGNEIGNGMLWPEGKNTNMNNLAGFIKSGYAAAKAIDSTIQVIVHLEDGHKENLFRQIFDGLKYYGAKWDIIGMSVYPYWANLSWTTDDSLALLTMKDMIARYNTKVMVCEAGYLYNQPVEANHYLLDLIEKTKSVGGLGVFYWEPESYNWQGYQLGAWDPSTKQPTVALDAFLGLGPTSVNEINNVYCFELKIFPNPFNPNTTIQYSLPQTEKVVIQVYNILGELVKTLVSDTREAGTHSVQWSGKNKYSNQVASGIYFVSLSYDGNFQIRKIVLLK
jgi:arabinogalactan endo-1,4-beta-galactosidase